MKKINLKVLTIVIFGLAIVPLAYLIPDINKTEKVIAESLLQKSIEITESNLDGFFRPVQAELLSIREQAQLGMFDSITPQLMNRYFGPILSNYSQISSMAIANTEGYEFDVIANDSIIDNRIVWVDKWGWKEYWTSWKNNPEQGSSVLIKEWEDSLKQDPRTRLWFTSALDTPKDQINWTEPYIFNTTFERGMSATVYWHDHESDKQNILALDLALSDLTKFTQSLNASPKGKVFVLTKDGRYIGLPTDPRFSDKSSIRHAILKPVDSTEVVSVSDAYRYWFLGAQPTKSFDFRSRGNHWWGKLTYFELSPGNSLIIGVIVPEEDILSKVKRTKRIIVGSLIFILTLTIFALYSYEESQKVNRLLSAKNSEINRQKILIQEKSEEITGSINYAKRIQNAILPTNHEIKKALPNSFILYKPKDIVSGDFYWLEEKDGWILFAAADCTGHGVPGALVSIICKNAISRSVLEYKESDPGRILNMTRKLVLKEFEKSALEVNDGMDIAFCALKKNHLKFAGAFNPLWLIRRGSAAIEVYKANKQPIGKSHYSSDFETHDIILNQGDTFYIFSDGFQDQFGGEKGKKFMSANFGNLLLPMQDESMDKQKQLLNHAFKNWKGDLQQLDDVCVIGVRIE